MTNGRCWRHGGREDGAAETAADEAVEAAAIPVDAEPESFEPVGENGLSEDAIPELELGMDGDLAEEDDPENGNLDLELGMEIEPESGEAGDEDEIDVGELEAALEPVDGVETPDDDDGPETLSLDFDLELEADDPENGDLDLELGMEIEPESEADPGNEEIDVSDLEAMLETDQSDGPSGPEPLELELDPMPEIDSGTESAAGDTLTFDVSDLEAALEPRETDPPVHDLPDGGGLETVPDIDMGEEDAGIGTESLEPPDMEMAESIPEDVSVDDSDITFKKTSEIDLSELENLMTGGEEPPVPEPETAEPDAPPGLELELEDLELVGSGGEVGVDPPIPDDMDFDVEPESLEIEEDEPFLTDADTIRIDSGSLELADFEMAGTDPSAGEQMDEELTAAADTADGDFELELQMDDPAEEDPVAAGDAAAAEEGGGPEAADGGDGFDTQELTGIEDEMMAEPEAHWLDIETIHAEEEPAAPSSGWKPSETAATSIEPPPAEVRQVPSSEVKHQAALSDTWEMGPASVAEIQKKIPSAQQTMAAATEVEKPPFFKRRVSVSMTGILMLMVLAAGLAGWAVLAGRPAIEDPGNLKIKAFDIKGQVLENSTAGSLFVIRGRVQNGYGHERSSVRVTGNLFLQGNFVKSEFAYCGNILPDGELATAGIPEIRLYLRQGVGSNPEAARIDAGGTLPFMIVFSDLPDDLALLDRYTVEVSGSTAL